MKRILITGATGNVSIEIIKSLHKTEHQLQIIAGVRDLEKGGQKLAGYKVSLREFDFTNIQTYKPALDNCEILFLLRPPQVYEVGKYFKPLIDIAKENKIKLIIFLSVQGVENSKIIPHHKIEKLIVESKIPYVFLRPAYFMQNFCTTLNTDLVNNKRIFLPAGNSKFTLIDIRDIGAVTANILIDTTQHLNKSYELTCHDKLTFKEMAGKLSEGLTFSIQYQSPTLLHFYLTKRKENMPFMFILVMIMLHYFPRFKKGPLLTGWVQKILGRQPITFDQFIKDNKTLLTRK